MLDTAIGSPTADSYITLADADAWHAARGNTLWATMMDVEREQALRRATDYIEQVYGIRWAGFRNSTTQTLSWPRSLVPMKDAAGYGQWQAYWPTDAVPDLVRHAAALLAFKAGAADLAPDLGAPVASKTVGPIAVTYHQGTRQTTKFRAIDDMLAPLLKGGGSTMTIVRA